LAVFAASLGDMNTDFLIIGGGVAGISVAARLSHLGQVTLLEAEDQLAYHASGRSAALYEPRYGPPAIKSLSLASGDYLRSAHGGVLSPRGLMLVAGCDQAAGYEAEAADLGLTQISIEAALAKVPTLAPDALGFAAFSEHAHDLDTDLLIQNFRRDGLAQGANLICGARAQSITRTAAGWQVVTRKGDFDGRILVNAAGAWVDEVAVMAGVAPLGFTPLRRSMARIPAPGGHDVSSWPMLFGAGESWYAKPDAGALIVSPSEEHRMAPHDAFADDMVLAEGLARYEAFSSAPVTRLITSWAGLRTFSPDRLPVAGWALDCPAFFWLAGQGGYGFQSAPALSQLAADLITGAPPSADAATVAALSPARFGAFA
jgi:D-arginine dehydrogenase